MMRTHKLWFLIAVAATLMAGGVGCKKDTAEGAKTYLAEGPLVDPNDVVTPKPDPCLDKGAVGAQALLLQADCDELKPPQCGNSQPDVGEQCDPPDGKTCDTKCQKITAPKPPSDQKLTIKTTAIKNGVIGKKYTSEQIEATGAEKGDSYVWSADGQKLPEGFELSVTSGSSGAKVQLVSKATASAGTYNATLKVCLKSNSATCDTQDFSFSISDQLTLSAFRYFGSKQSLCDSNQGSCADVILDPGANIMGYVNANGPKSLLYVWVSALVNTDKSYQWSLSYKDGTATKDVPDVRASDQHLCNPVIMPAGKPIDSSCNGKTIKFPDGIFLFEPLHHDDQGDDVGDDAGKGSYHRHQLMFSADAYGKTYNDVVITVKNSLGNVQKLTFKTIKIPSLADIQTAANKKAEIKQAELAKCSDLNVEGITFEGRDPFYGISPNEGPDAGRRVLQVDWSGYSKNVINWTTPDEALRVDKSYDGVLKITGGSGKYEVTNLKYSPSDEGTPEGEPSVTDKVTIHWTPFLNYNSANYTVTDTTTFDVSDDSPTCKQTHHVTVYRSLKYPDYRTYTIKDVKLYADFDTEWTDGDSKVIFDLHGKGDQGQDVVLASTGEVGVDGGDPTCFNKSFTFIASSMEGHKDDPITQITHVTMQEYDDASTDMLLNFKYLRLDVVDGGKVLWHADAEGNFGFEHDVDGAWGNYNIGRPGDYSTFKANYLNYDSIWFYGEPAAHSQESSCD